MGTYVTPTGLKRKTLQEIRLELETSFKEVFGPDFETSVDSPNGLFVGHCALALSNIWELAYEVFISRDPNQAEGVALDFAAALNGILRKTAQACSVEALVFTDKANATIPAGSQAVRTRGNLFFNLDADVAISREGCERLLILDDGSSKNTEYVFHFTFGDVTLNNDTQASNIERLRTLISSAGGQCEFLDGTASGGLLVWDDDLVGITGTLPEDWVVLAANTGNFTATETGVQTCEVGELDEIARPVTGWEKVYNIVAGVPGTSTESDNAFRVRREQSALEIKSTGTDPAIAAHLMNEVNGVTNAVVISNRALTTDTDGRPGKCFETMVVGGSDEEVAYKIWENLPSGMQPYGTTEVPIVDENGDQQIIAFSRPAPKYLWIKVTYKLYNEEIFPGAAALKQSILEWGEKEYGMGKDVIRDRIYSALYPPFIKGVGAATIEIAVTDEANETPTYGTADISIARFEYADVDLDRITLVQQQN